MKEVHRNKSSKAAVCWVVPGAKYITEVIRRDDATDKKLKQRFGTFQATGDK